MKTKMLKKAYSFSSYAITYFALLSLALTVTRFSLNIFFKGAYSSNYTLINSLLLLIWGTIVFIFVKKCYTPRTWVNRLF